MVRKQVKALTVLYLVPCQHFGVYFAPYQILLVIVNAAPIGSNIAVYAQRLGLDSSYAVQMVCLSTLLSLITLPVILSLAAVFGFV